MIGSQTEHVSIPSCDIVAAALVRVAMPFFVIASSGDGLGLDFARWQFLRYLAATLSLRRALELSFTDRRCLAATLELCEPSPDVDFLKSIEFAERS
jgi:hypothetical protein